MSTYLELVQKLLLYTEKMPYAETNVEQRELALQDVNDAVRYVYNNGDLSFKTVILRGFEYLVSDDTSLPGKGTPLPSDFMGFHQTGFVFLEDYPEKDPLIYLPYHKIILMTEGPGSVNTGIPTHYGLGGPNDSESELNQRELLLWPIPATFLTRLKLIYQRAAPNDKDLEDADEEIPRIPATWHIPVILTMAKMFRKMDKGADESALAKTLATAIKQMNIQEPHGREKARHRPVHPAWR